MKIVFGLIGAGCLLFASRIPEMYAPALLCALASIDSMLQEKRE